MLKWALYLYNKSSGEYGFIELPSLKNFEGLLSAHTGLSIEADSLQLSEAEKLDEWQKHVILILDEMYVKENLMYDKHTGVSDWLL